MHGEESRRKRRRLGLVALWLGAGLLVVVAIRSISVTDADRTGLAEEATNRPVERTIRVKTVEFHPADPNRPEVEPGDFDLTADETTSISAHDLPTEDPLVLNLLLPAALPSADALPARIVAMDGSRELKLSDAVVAGDRVRVQIESGWLSPGRYRIEIETTEQSQLALRHYPLEVR
ncbi:MAG: hypothetical protein IH974_03560 [Myxococcales bacterium]|nr:hypothetical protein [Myxococcales bacterium]